MRNLHKFVLPPDAAVLFATFSAWENGKRLPTNGSVEPLRDFIVPKIRKLVLIDQLVPGGKDIMPKIEIYTRGSMRFVSPPPTTLMKILRPILRLTNRPATVVSFKIRDFLSVIECSIREKTLFDYLIGVESVNAIAGILLRKFGRVKKVIYYVSDYSPNRYHNKIFNDIYLWLDRFAAMHSDYIWDVSLAIQSARISVGLDPNKSAPVIHVANGLFLDQINALPFKDIQRHSMVYMGTVGPENGPDVAIEALSLIRKKYPDASLHMIGGQEKDFVWLLPLIRKLKLQNAVIHYGFVPNASDMAKLMRACGIGLAPYRAIPGSPRYYGDAGKIRAYCGAGLAVICSEVPPLGKDVTKKGAAIQVADSPESFASAIFRLFADERLYIKMRRNAEQYAKNNSWENQFKNAFKKMNQ